MVIHAWWWAKSGNESNGTWANSAARIAASWCERCGDKVSFSFSNLFERLLLRDSKTGLKKGWPTAQRQKQVSREDVTSSRSWVSNSLSICSSKFLGLQLCTRCHKVKDGQSSWAAWCRWATSGRDWSLRHPKRGSLQTLTVSHQFNSLTCFNSL